MILFVGAQVVSLQQSHANWQLIYSERIDVAVFSVILSRPAAKQYDPLRFHPADDFMNQDFQMLAIFSIAEITVSAYSTHLVASSSE